jgi:hypothetical protein
MRFPLARRFALALPALAVLGCSDQPPDTGDVSLQLASHTRSRQPSPGLPDSW